jgi:hypothetical protein
VIIPYGHVSVDNPKVIQEIQTFADAGFRGVKMHTPKYNWDDFGYFPIYDKLQSLRLVALFHTGIVSGDSDEPEPSSMARMRPSFLHTIARSFPKLVIQGAHLGNPWYDEAARSRAMGEIPLLRSDRLLAPQESEEPGRLQRLSLVGRADGAQFAGRGLRI